MYYLLKYQDDVTIVSNCKSLHHKIVVLSNYCKNNNITLVSCREEINEKNRSINQLFCYPVDLNKWIIISATYHEQTLFFNEYSEKHVEGYFEFQYYVHGNLPILNVKIEKEMTEDFTEHMKLYGTILKNR